MCHPSQTVLHQRACHSDEFRKNLFGKLMHRFLALASIFIIQFTGMFFAFADAADFVRDVRPILQQHCYSCHGPESQKSGLRLDIKSAAFKGGDGWGPSLVAGNANESPLFELVASDDTGSRMPPEGDRLSADKVRTLRQWIDEGAIWPDGVDLAKLDDPLDHWSFKPLIAPEVPETRESGWARNAIDHFVLAHLVDQGLTPAAEADALTWLRRVTLDLTGLPPTVQEVTEFLQQVGCGANRGDAAYSAIVDRLLQSPRYGERYAQHWLDVVRYADTHGFEVNTERPNAWPYRDYVIDAFNRDTPYDRFIEEQIVGDALGSDAATGFLVTASVLLPGQIGKDAPSIRSARQDSLDEIVNNISQSFLGLSVGCARCHDHKFDPISARDYYGMQAFVAGVEYADREMHSLESEAIKKEADSLRQRIIEIEQRLDEFEPLAQPSFASRERPKLDDQSTDLLPQRATVFPSRNVDRFEPVRAKQLRFTVLATNSLEPCIDELEVFDTAGNNIALSTVGTTFKTSGDNITPDRHEPRFIHDGEYGNSRSWMSNQLGEGWVELTFAEEREVCHVVWGRDRTGKFQDRLAIEYRIEIARDEAWSIVADSTDRRPWVAGTDPGPMFTLDRLDADEKQTAKRLQAEKKKLAAKIKTAERGQLAFSGSFRKPDDIHLLRRGDPEQPQEKVVPSVLSAIGDVTLSSDTAEQDRRKALAQWLVSPENPLTARVMVNRIWQWHFGTGFVDTPNDFGKNGTPPSHSELLDWLAVEFMQSGWSIKQMHRMVVLSSTYRQSTQYNANAADVDAEARLLWRYPSRRIEAEAIRDCMLAVSDRLNLRVDGPGFNLFNQRGGLSGFTPIESFTGDGLRRMVYSHKVRRERDAVFGAFDCPDAGQSAARRIESTTPVQALNLLNSQFTIEQAAAFAIRTQTEADNDVKSQIGQAYWVALNRQPSEDEVVDAESVVRKHGLETLCRALFNCNEFLFLP